MQVDVVILGAGAAGLFCAGEAVRRGRSVLVIEHNAAPGEKIRISGGGRCNFTNLNCSAERFLSQNPRFALSALGRFGPADFLARVEASGIAWHEKTGGQLFCDGPATQIIAMLLRGMAGAALWTGTSFAEVVKEDHGFAVQTSRRPVRAGRVVVATGGKSIPKMGASDAGYRIAAGFGLPLVPMRPALVPLTFAEQELAWMKPLAGTALPSARLSHRVNKRRQSFDDAVLFTHRGLSGPAVLQISSYWREGDMIVLDMSAGAGTAARLRELRATRGRQAVATALSTILPERLARHLAERAGFSGNLADVPNAGLERLDRLVHALELRPVGSEGYRTAEVTLGGVATEALDPRSFEARNVPGLHFIGEVVDVTGWLGGYNFQWAWSSGWAAGQAV